MGLLKKKIARNRMYNPFDGRVRRSVMAHKSRTLYDRRRDGLPDKDDIDDALDQIKKPDR